MTASPKYYPSLVMFALCSFFCEQSFEQYSTDDICLDSTKVMTITDLQCHLFDGKRHNQTKILEKSTSDNVNLIVTAKVSQNEKIFSHHSTFDQPISLRPIPS